MNLGKKGTDKITGFTGTIIGYVEYSTGCNQYLIVPKCSKGETNKKPEGHWIDASRITIETKHKRKEITTKESTGSDISPHT